MMRTMCSVIRKNTVSHRKSKYENPRIEFQRVVDIMEINEIKGKVDFGIITIREDEFKAVLKRFKPKDFVEGNRGYRLSRVKTVMSEEYLIAIVRCPEKGEGEAQNVARDLIIDLDPQWLVLVGICGSVPADEFTLGDVVIATRIHDFCVGAAIENKKSEFAIGGGPMHPIIQSRLGDLPAMEEELKGWNDQRSIGVPRPKMTIQSSNIYGSKEWQDKVTNSLVKHFGSATQPRPPIFTTGSIASSDLLIKDSKTIQEWKEIARDIIAMEMELAGVYKAARRIDREYPILAIRGISDIVGLNRDHNWSLYACNSAASFAYAYIKTQPILPWYKEESKFKKAYLIEPHGHMLRRERLSKSDLETGHAIKPRYVEKIVNALIKGKSVAVQGPPGSGKSALAAWSNWLAEKNGQHVATFFGQYEQEKDVEEVCKQLEEIPSNYIILIDDIHLLEKVLERLVFLPWSEKRVFLLFGRDPFVQNVLRSGQIPEIDEKIINITVEDSSVIAEALAKQYINKENVNRLLQRTNRDLVLTKWFLEAIELNGAKPDSEPVEAAITKLQDIKKNEGNEIVRLFLTISAFSWLELWCPENFLMDILDFEPETIERLQHRLYEVERQIRPEVQGNYALRLLRHPKLCGLFLEAAPSLLGFEKRVFAPTCKASKLQVEAMKPYGFVSVVLGAALNRKFADLLKIEWRLVYSGHGLKFVNIVKVAAKLSLVPQKELVGLILSNKEKRRRLEFAFAAANGERRMHGGQAGKALLEDLKRQLGVFEIPEEPFSEKGYMLYQDAYLMRLNNDKRALERFEESAKADEAWAQAHNSLIHCGKAAMSRIAACAYGIDIAVFGHMSHNSLHPDRSQLNKISTTLKDAYKTIEGLSASQIDEKGQRMLKGFRTNALLHRAETAGWLGDETMVNICLAPFTDDSIRQAIGLARGALALIKEQYEQVITELEGQPEDRVKFGTSEGAGKTGVMLLISYMRVGRLDDAEKMRPWLLSDQCPLDAGNGLAKNWVSDFFSIGGNLR